MTLTKSEQREQVISARNRIVPVTAFNAAQAIIEHFMDEPRFAPFGDIGGYKPIRGELDVLPLLDALNESGKATSLPVMEPNSKLLSYRSWKPDELLAIGPFGIEQPPHTATLATPDLLLVPLVAFDQQGYRLGYGGGFYDATLRHARDTGKPFMAVGIAYQMQGCEAIRAESFDEKLDAVITERGVTWFEAKAA